MAQGGSEKNEEFWKERYERLGHPIVFLSPRQALRINTLKAKKEMLIPRLKKQVVQLFKIPFTKNGYWAVSKKVPLGAITEHLLGYYYLQSDVAQLPVEVLSPRPGELVLDACAAPGGKTTQLCAEMQNKGLVIAVEKKQFRIPQLFTNLERCGCSCALVYKLDARKVEKLGIQFDRVLLDAPCSGNYVTDPEWLGKRTIGDIKTSSRIQKRLLEACINVTKEGGTIVYSTCSLEPEENEINIEWVLEQGFPVRVEEIRLSAGEPGLTKVFDETLSQEIALTKRFWPELGSEGFYIAKMVKK